MTTKQNKITVNEFCLLNRIKQVDREFMNVKFKDELNTNEEWKKILKKEGVTF